MFHRVLPQSDPRWGTAEDTYTISDTLFENCLRFFKQHCSVISLADLRAARNGTGSLPDRPLLVTFDDGWLDNQTIALPLLRKHGVPAVIFIASSILDDAHEIWWHDLVVNGWNTHALSTDVFVEFRRAIGLAGDLSEGNAWQPGASLLDVMMATARLEETARDRFLRPLAESRPFAPPRQMLDRAHLQRLAADGLIDIGAHGHSHLPLTRVQNAAHEMATAKALLEQSVHTASAGGIYSLSFPHGCYDDALVQDAAVNGFELVFTSDAILNPIAGRPDTVLGRIGIESRSITDSTGAFAPDRLATWLFTRPVGLNSKKRKGA
jgi:peptidoglycan/xylan/chitin deacetylase (PgdA/CDA1 family)